MMVSLLQVEQPVTQTESYKWWLLCCKWKSQSHKRSHADGGFSAASRAASHKTESQKWFFYAASAIATITLTSLLTAPSTIATVTQIVFSACLQLDKHLP